MMKIIKNYLFVTEGSVDEQNIFEQILLKYGFNPCLNDSFVGEDGLKHIKLSNEKNNVIIVQGPRNRISDFLKHYQKNRDDIESFFNYAKNNFQGIFLIYDVDHNSPSDIEEMFSLFNDESSGLLLLSSPCLEVLGDYNRNRTELVYNHLSQYKHELNRYYDLNEQTNVINYIIKNFEALVLYYLDKNRDEYGENNIMLHPSLIIPSINQYNERVNNGDPYVVYRYFTTVLYVAIAYINGLTRQIDNYQIVRDFFKLKLKDNQ